MSSLCDRCYAPGQCCKRLHLFDEKDEAPSFWRDTLWEDVAEYRAKHQLPFSVSRIIGEYVDETTKCTYVSVEWQCPWLLPSGRCGCYEHRPDLCKNFEAGVSGPLCVHYGGAEGGDYYEGPEDESGRAVSQAGY